MALFGAFYGGFRAMLQKEVLPLLADTSLSFFSILWWHLSREGAATAADTLFAGAATLVTAGMILVWTRIRARYGNLPPERIGGLAEAMPRLALPVILLAMAGAGLPPFGLFSGFLMLLLGSPDPVGRPASGLLILFVWFLASWTMFRLMQRLLFGERKGELVARDLAGPEIAPLVLVLIVLVVLGLIPYLAPSGGATDRALFPGKGAA
jgi:NADH-quinone oxidoreductase subunit M